MKFKKSIELPIEDIKHLADDVAVSTQSELLEFNILNKIPNLNEKKKLSMIASRPGMGKSTFMLQVAAACALFENEHCHIFSAKDAKEELAYRTSAKQHHFAHKLHHLCSDSWEREHTYDISPWHNEWQNKFPKENQEIKLEFGDTHHRADVMIGRTVVEFQHSIMPVKFFDERNNFYHNLGYKVIWLFDLSPLYEEGQLNKEKNQ